MGFNVDLWQLLLGNKPETPPIPEDVSDPRNYPNRTLYGPQDVYDAYRSLKYGEDTVPKPPRVGNPRDIALPVPPGQTQPPPIEQAIAARGPEELNAVAEPAPSIPRPRGQVQVTIGGKTYDYAKGESIDDSLKGRMGPMTEPVYAYTAGGATQIGERQYGGQGGRGSASMVELSDDSTTPMADQLREEKLGRTIQSALQARADADVADPYGARRAREEEIATGGAIRRGQAGIEQAVERERMKAALIAQEEKAEHSQIDMDADREFALRLAQKRMTPEFQNADLAQRTAIEQAARAAMQQHVEQLKREASVALYARYGVQRVPTGLGSDPNALMTGNRP